MKKGKKNVIANICVVTGILCFMYFLIYALFVDLTNTFTYFWLLLGIVFLLCKPLFVFIESGHIRLPISVKVTVITLFFILLGVFIITESVIITYGSKKPQPDADYVLVLGAQVKNNSISYALQARLDVAYEYAVKNPKSIIIVSGGKGPSEQITEAYAMSEYLKSKGIEENRIILEECSTSTHENIAFSKKFIENLNDRVVLVTNHFHVYRGVGVAKKQGLTNLESLGAPVKWYTVPNQYVREAFAVVKYKLFGQI